MTDHSIIARKEFFVEKEWDEDNWRYSLVIRRRSYYLGWFNKVKCKTTDVSKFRIMKSYTDEDYKILYDTINATCDLYVANTEGGVFTGERLAVQE